MVGYSVAQGGLCLEGTTPSEQGKQSSSFKSLCRSHIPRGPCHKAWGPYPSLFSLTALWFVFTYLRVLLLKRFFPYLNCKVHGVRFGFVFVLPWITEVWNSVWHIVRVQLIIVEQTTAPVRILLLIGCEQQGDRRGSEEKMATEQGAWDGLT